jgi:hypothetical protein
VTVTNNNKEINISLECWQTLLTNANDLTVNFGWKIMNYGTSTFTAAVREILTVCEKKHYFAMSVPMLKCHRQIFISKFSSLSENFSCFVI